MIACVTNHPKSPQYMIKTKGVLLLHRIQCPCNSPKHSLTRATISVKLRLRGINKHIAVRKLVQNQERKKVLFHLRVYYRIVRHQIVNWLHRNKDFWNWQLVKRLSLKIDQAQISSSIRLTKSSRNQIKKCSVLVCISSARIRWSSNKKTCLARQHHKKWKLNWFIIHHLLLMRNIYHENQNHLLAVTLYWVVASDSQLNSMVNLWLRMNEARIKARYITLAKNHQNCQSHIILLHKIPSLNLRKQGRCHSSIKYLRLHQSKHRKSSRTIIWKLVQTQNI